MCGDVNKGLKIEYSKQPKIYNGRRIISVWLKTVFIFKISFRNTYDMFSVKGIVFILVIFQMNVSFWKTYFICGGSLR